MTVLNKNSNIKIEPRTQNINNLNYLLFIFKNYQHTHIISTIQIDYVILCNNIKLFIFLINIII